MNSESWFCAAESRACGEEIFGTVARIRSWKLLEYPSVWRRHAIEDSWLISEAVKKHLAASAERSLLIRQDHTRSGSAKCFVVDSCEDRPRMHRTVVEDYDELLKKDIPLERVGGLLFAVCTHGRHDKCCAKFGRPVACAFRDYAGDRAWECSHVGGDRFAGNVVVFPYGIYYGRVVPEDVPEIIRRSEMGEVWLPRYRGRSCYSRPVQIAEYFARAESGRMGIHEFTPLSNEPAYGNARRVSLRARSDGAVYIVEFETNTNELSGLLTCGASERSEIPRHKLRSLRVVAPTEGQL